MSSEYSPSDWVTILTRARPEEIPNLLFEFSDVDWLMDEYRDAFRTGRIIRPGRSPWRTNVRGIQTRDELSFHVTVLDGCFRVMINYREKDYIGRPFLWCFFVEGIVDVVSEIKLTDVEQMYQDPDNPSLTRLTSPYSEHLLPREIIDRFNKAMGRLTPFLMGPFNRPEAAWTALVHTVRREQEGECKEQLGKVVYPRKKHATHPCSIAVS